MALITANRCRDDRGLIAYLKQGSQLTAVLGLLLSCSAPASEPQQRDVTTTSGQYEVLLTAKPEPALEAIIVGMQIRQNDGELRQLRLSAPVHMFQDFVGEGELQVEGESVTWDVPARGGTLSWTVNINQKRAGGGFDSYMTSDWALFRGADILPPATTRAVAGSLGETTLQFELPSGWSSISEYSGKDDRYRIDNPERRFDRPTGWILLGRVGTRTEIIAGTRITVAAPVGQGVRRMDMLAMLRWIIPDARRIFASLPTRITIFSAGDPMWRGGLSAPSSIFLHSDRPLISENGTSTLAHEIVHLGLGNGAAEGSDWITEGLAEYYGLQLLLRSGTISESRYEKAIRQLENWGDNADTLCTSRSKGAVNARAAVLFHELNEELIKTTSGKHNLDDVIRVLASQHEKFETRQLRSVVSNLAGRPSDVLNNPLICDP